MKRKQEKADESFYWHHWKTGNWHAIMKASMKDALQPGRS
jgi:hypothetical protein